MQQDWIALVIGCALMLAGVHTLKKLNPSLTIRVTLGAVMLVSSIFLIYPLLGTAMSLEEHQVRFGFAIALGGLGINQLASPLRVAFGRPA